MHTETHSYIHGHTSRIHTATKSSNHRTCVWLLLTILVPLEATPHSLRNPTSVKHATRRNILTFSFHGNDENAGACRWKKTRSGCRQSLALPDASNVQEIAHRDHASCSVTRERGCTIDNTHSRLHRSEVTREREGGGANADVCGVFPVFDWSLTKMTDAWKKVAGAPSVRFWSTLVYRTFDRSSP